MHHTYFDLRATQCLIIMDKGNLNEKKLSTTSLNHSNTGLQKLIIKGWKPQYVAMYVKVK